MGDDNPKGPHTIPVEEKNTEIHFLQKRKHMLSSHGPSKKNGKRELKKIDPLLLPSCSLSLLPKPSFTLHLSFHPNKNPPLNFLHKHLHTLFKTKQIPATYYTFCKQ